MKLEQRKREIEYKLTLSEVEMTLVLGALNFKCNYFGSDATNTKELLDAIVDKLPKP